MPFPAPQPLPVDSLLPEIAASLKASPNLVLESPPGTGKTTRVPAALLDPPAGRVLVLEPRRLAARMAAARVAFERGERLGRTVGYQVRFEEVRGPSTRLLFLTEGVLLRRLLSDPLLGGVDAVVLDEFHERHLDGDLALALLRRLQRERRPELRLVVMSATLAAAPLAAHLSGCRVIRSEGRLHEISTRYTPHSSRPLEDEVACALEKALAEGIDGHVLVFLPGAREIRRAGRACEGAARRAGMAVMALHGDLSLDEQARVLEPSDQTKLILSTNVAESSVTVDGVTVVIDSGLARVAANSPWSGLPSLNVARISKASAIQRAGRAGRTRPGRVFRLYSEEDFLRRPDRDLPEIQRRELSEHTLGLLAMGVSWEELPLLDAPPPAAVAAAGELLRRLGAADERGRLTPSGRRMSRSPLHPRLARLILEGERRGAEEDACAVAALLSAGARLTGQPHAGPSDLLALADGDWPDKARRLFQQIRRRGKPGGPARGRDDTALRISVLAAFPDRVARRRQARDLLLAGGGSAILAETSVVTDAEFLVAVEVEDRADLGRPLVRLASAIEPGWLIDLFPERVREHDRVEWNRAAERAEGVSALRFDAITIQESRGAPDPDRAAALLAEKAIEAGPERFCDPEEFRAYLARAAFAAKHSSVKPLTQEDVEEALRALASGLRSFAELEAAARAGGLLRALDARLGADALRALDTAAPARIRLPSGRSARVHYGPHQPPWIASRLQDFFGLRETPRVAGGRVPLVLHLLAPNQRPVQTTTDLTGFWQRLYPRVRRELSRRYPKHAWPEDPLGCVK